MENINIRIVNRFNVKWGNDNTQSTAGTMLSPRQRVMQLVGRKFVLLRRFVAFMAVRGSKKPFRCQDDSVPSKEMRPCKVRRVYFSINDLFKLQKTARKLG
jgi:hypothetical protein